MQRSKGKGKRTHSKVGDAVDVPNPNEYQGQPSSPFMQIPRRNSINNREYGQTNGHAAKQHRWKPSSPQQRFNMDPPDPANGPRSFAGSGGSILKRC